MIWSCFIISKLLLFDQLVGLNIFDIILILTVLCILDFVVKNIGKFYAYDF